MYDARECRCFCNDSEETVCEKPSKVWNSDICSCQCVEELDCTTGYKFDYNTCRCEMFKKNLTIIYFIVPIAISSVDIINWASCNLKILPTNEFNLFLSIFRKYYLTYKNILYIWHQKYLNDCFYFTAA